MSFSFSASGTPGQASKTVETAHVPEEQHLGEIARATIMEMLASMPETSNTSVSAYGHHGGRQGSVTISVSYSPVDPASQTAPTTGSGSGC